MGSPLHGLSAVDSAPVQNNENARELREAEGTTIGSSLTIDKRAPAAGLGTLLLRLIDWRTEHRRLGSADPKLASALAPGKALTARMRSPLRFGWSAPVIEAVG